MARREDNLITQAQRSPEERRAIASAGGKASQRAARKRRETRALIRQVLDSEVRLTKKQQAELAKAGIDPENMTIEILGIVAIANQFMAGDLAAAKFLYDYAQIPDLRSQLERERLKSLQTEGKNIAALKQAREILGGVDSVIK